MIKLDYYPGTHGHFLEYVANVYIMKTPPSATTIFSPIGIAHNTDDTYKNNRCIISHHYSWFNEPFDVDDQIIRIVIDADNDAECFVGLVNVAVRAADNLFSTNQGFEYYTSNIPESVRSSRLLHRDHWYSKIIEGHYQKNLPREYTIKTEGVFEFPFNAFFDWALFCKNLNLLAFFLKQEFFADESLYKLWKFFIDNNHGYQSLIKCNQLLEEIFSNRSATIDCTLLEESWINYNLAKISRLYEGPMFNSEQYPSTTTDIYTVIQDYYQKTTLA